MRLLHSERLEVEDFSSKPVPPYAVLSHTWGDEEVSFQDMQGSSADQKAGYIKVKRCCNLAVDEGFDYVWMDTCCIDKTSSAELSEAINSMYRWYQQAEVCYVYLFDVPSREDPRIQGSSFARSKWFTRGWTLQELIAPSNLIFFGSDWEEIGTKSFLQSTISEITGINVNILLGGDLESVSVAQRMSWASRRKTTRVEDLAYSLMGIFGVYMPMLYGEGERAFIRLQEEIMKVSDDHTIFAWRSADWWDHEGGLLASSPAAFANSSNIIKTTQVNRTAHFTITNKGLHIQLPLNASSDPIMFLALLNCQEVGNDNQLLGIWLRDISGVVEDFERCRVNEFERISILERIETKSVYITLGRPSLQSNAVPYRHFFIRMAGVLDYKFSLSEIYPPTSWMRSDGMVTSMASPDSIFGALNFRDVYGRNFAVLLKKKQGFLSTNVVMSSGSETLKEIVRSFDVNSSGSEREWVDEPDRIYRKCHTPESTVFQYLDEAWVCVAIRRQIISEQKHLVIDISVIPNLYG